ncbi:dihydrolipoyl dehydrogenase family protein [Elioraea thermophila]|uniref:dihydrolipoyl dehydrogenase family protein n=1 Tax=Elioraea thermophila TaxID=2185104 RepID=UPI000DF4222C|nr:FAD-dependent oxidoreductase [Elioraea thermophila]
MAEADLVVIGAGAAGLSVVAGAAQLGARVVLIERAAMGGECLNAGCVPSKALLAVARRVAMARQAARFGIRTEGGIDLAAVMAEVRRAVAEIAPNDSAHRYRALGARVIHGEARFSGRDRVVVGDETIIARRIVIAAGTRPAIPAIPGLDQVAFLTNETLWSLDAMPRHLIVLGAGAMGLEMAQAFARLGARVTVLEVGRALAREEAELVGGLLLALREDGVAVREGMRLLRVEPDPAGLAVVLAAGEGREERLVGSHLLLATGRVPNLEALGLERADVETTPQGIRVDRGLRSVSNRRVFAAGDIADIEGVGPQRFTHAASHHAGVILRRVLFRLPATVACETIPRSLYTDPELAAVGLTEAEARARGIADLAILRWPIAETDRAATEGVRHGLIKIIASRRGRVLGASVLAPHAGEMIGLLALAIRRGVSLATLADLVLPYPTYAESIRRAAGNFFAPRLLAPATRRLVRALSRLP